MHVSCKYHFMLTLVFLLRYSTAIQCAFNQQNWTCTSQDLQWEVGLAVDNRLNKFLQVHVTALKGGFI